MSIARVKSAIRFRAALIQRRLDAIAAERRAALALNKPVADWWLRLFVGLLFAVLTLALTGCTARRTGKETAVLRTRIAEAGEHVGKSRADAKQIVQLVHSAADLQRRINFKTSRALKLLDR